jgi:branched-chain amino acid transport system substrate-binding protein
VARQLVNKFQKSDRIDVAAGFSFSNLMLAVYGPLTQAGTVTISSNPGPSQIAGKECSPYFFSTSWQGDSWAEAMGAYLQKKGVQNIYLLAPNYAAGKDVLTGFKRFYKGSVAGEVYTPLSQLDFSAELAQIRATNPSAVFAFFPGGLGIQFVKQYSQAGLKDKFTLYTSYTIDNTTLPAIGEDAVGLINTTFWNAGADNPVTKKFVADFQAKFGRPPAEYAAQAMTRSCCSIALSKPSTARSKTSRRFWQRSRRPISSRCAVPSASTTTAFRSRIISRAAW